MQTGTMFDSLDQYSATPGTSNGGLAGQAAQQNLAATPTIDSVTKQIQDINQNAYLSAPGRSQELSTIQNQLAGNLDPSTIYQNQMRNAEQYGAAGFPSDSQAWQTAVQRGLGIDRQALISSGQAALDSFYSKLPTIDAQSQLVTPGLLQQQQAANAAQALEAQRVANQVSQFNQTLKQNEANSYASTYGAIPGYNEYGQYTGQTGRIPTTAELYAQWGLTGPTASASPSATATATTATPKSTTPSGFNDKGEFVSGGQYTSGYFDRQGHFYGNQTNPALMYGNIGF